MAQPTATLSSQPRSGITGSLSDLLMKAKNGLNNVNIPMLGGAGDLVLGGTPELLDDVSYNGMSALNSGGPTFQTFNLDPRTIDAASMLPVAKAGKLAGTVAKKGAKELSPIANDLMQSYMQKVGAAPSILPPERFRGKPLEGMQQNIMVDGRMDQFGTDQRLVDIARQYTADRGLPYIEQPRYASVDPDRASRIASAYEAMPDNPLDPAVSKSFDALSDETMAQYEALRKAGYQFDFMPGGVDKYGNPRNAINDLISNKRMSVFPTESGFGTINDAGARNPLLRKTGEKWGGQDVLVNDMFRAVHDAFGHGKHGVGFRAAGEENAYQAHARMFSPEALPALASETRGQNSWVNFGPFGQQNQLVDPANTIYADQKTGLMPEWAWTEGLLK